MVIMIYQYVDLLIGGSPCTGFSKAGKKLNFNDPHSKLFFEYVRIKNEINPKNFLLENVNMKKDFIDIISNFMNVEPLKINSSLLSSQNRERLYWTDIKNINIPNNENILLCDIIDQSLLPKKKINIERLKKSYFSINGMNEFHKNCIAFTTITRFKAGKENEKKWVKIHDETIVQRGEKHPTLTTAI